MADVTAQMIKDLRERTGAGMADCKKALSECAADMEKAIDYLRKKGIAAAAKKSTRIASEGTVASYLHGGRIGVIVEVNCETDFVARNPDFVDFAREIAMQVAAMNPQYVSQDEIPPAVVENEKSVRTEQAQDLGQARVGDPEDHRGPARQVGQGDLPARSGVGEGLRGQEGHPCPAHGPRRRKTGENVRIRRFIRFEVGEGLEKRSDDFVAEVKKQAGQA